ncbi:MAG: metallophosphoesterase family protein [Candidatus Freyarchaeota archaeon]
MKPFSFVHTADLHLGYSQYNLDTRRRDLERAFQEVVDKTIELKPDFMIIAGDLFHHARPSNTTLETAITNFRRLREAGIPVLTVDGSHDSAPNVVTGTILNPLDSAGLLRYLPRHEGASWRNESCYVYGVPNFRTRRRTEEMLPDFMERNKPNPDPNVFNIFVFHMALDISGVKPSRMEAEANLQMLPEGFNYYAGGHVHTPHKLSMNGSLIVYSGCIETISYEDADVEKGFYYIEVDGDGTPTLHRIELETPRPFIILDRDYTGLTPTQITEIAVGLVKEADKEGAVIVPILRGVLPAGTGRGEIDVTKIREASEKALLVHPLLRLREEEVPEEVVRSIFEGKLKDLKTKAFEYFLEIFSARYGEDTAGRVARLAINLVEPLVRNDEDRVKEMLEEFLHED